MCSRILSKRIHLKNNSKSNHPSPIALNNYRPWKITVPKRSMGFPRGSDGKENPYNPAVTSHFHLLSLRIYLFWKFLINGNFLYFMWGFLGGSEVKNLPANTRDVGLIPGLRRSPGEENGNPLQHSYLGNPMDRGAWGLQSMRLQRVGHDWAINAKGS